MRIAYHLTGSNTRNPLGGWISILIALLLIAPFTTLRAQEAQGPVEVTAAGVEAIDSALVIDLTTSRVAGVRTFNLTSPDRLVFDIEDAVLSLGEDAVAEWPNPISGVTILTIEQFSSEPPIVRIVAEITNGALQTDRMAGPDELKLAVYTGQSPFVDSGPGAPPEHMSPIVDAFWHETIDQGRDKFTIEFSFGVVLPQIRIESPTVLLLRFAGTDINLPETSNGSFGTGVGGNIVERMRAERAATGPDIATEIRLTVPDTSALGYTLETTSGNTIELILFEEHAAEPEPPVEAPEPAPMPVEGGQIMVLSTGDGVPVASDAAVKVNRVQFQSIDGQTDRFYVFYEGGELEPRVQRYNYPTRVALYFPDTAVVLPESAEGRFQSVVDGIVADELKVFNRVIEDVGPECQFIFYFPDVEPENVGLSLDYVDPGEMHIDFYHAASPLTIESPIEVNTSIDEGPPEPTEPEVVVEELPEVVIEEEPEVEITSVEDQPEPQEVEPEPVVEESVESERPLLIVDVGEYTDNMVNFIITTSEPMPNPEWVDYRFPNRLGLVFPLSDIHLYEADPGVISSYTHVPIAPLVRAIIKDRPDEQHTIITFTLDGDLEEYTCDYEPVDGGFLVTLNYSPMPEAPAEPAPIEPEAAPDVPETPQAAAPVEQVTVEEPPVIEEPLEVEPAPVEPEVEEPPVVEEEPETEEPVTPATLGALPHIDVAVVQATGGMTVFDISTSEQLPMPEWVEYRYPDRLGLRFPLADVTLLGEDVNTAQTHIDDIPIVRTIVKDQPDEQHTTVTFTLSGTLEDYENELSWNGDSMQVAFVRMRAAAAPEAPPTVEPETPAVPDQPVIVEVEVEAMPEEEAPVEEEVVVEEPAPVVEVAEEPEIEEAEPVIIADGFVIEEEEYEIGQQVVEVNFEGGDEYKDFDGTLINSLTFEKMDGADVIRLAADSTMADWEVTPINFPTKLLVRIPNARPVMPNGDMMRYDERVGGNIVDQITANTTMSMGVTYTILTIYAHDLESTSMLDYDVQKQGNSLSIAVFRAGGHSPLGMQQSGEMTEPALIMEREPGDLEPRSVRPVEVPDEEVDMEDLEEPIEPVITLRLEEANVRDVLQLIAEQANLNISIGPSVRGTATISLTEVPLFELLDLLGDQHGFTYFLRSGVYIFGDPVSLQGQFDYWPRWYISLSYADPDQVRAILTALQVLANNQIQVYRGTFGGAGGVVIASPVMLLTGEERDLQRAYQIISAIDQPPVMIQVDFQILNTSITDSENFGFQFNFGTGSGQTNLYFSEQVSADPDMGPLPQGFDRLRLGTQNVYSINYVINYLLESGYAELMNRSSLTVANNQSGQLFVGENIPYRSTFQVSELGRVTQRVATQSVGLTLNFRPHANPDGTVTMYLTPSNSNLLELTDVGPRTVDQRFSTTVRVKNNEPFIIGGFIRDEQRVNYDRFPFLSELPLLGHLFRNREIQNTRSELIFVFTPHIIRPTRHLPEIYTDSMFEVPEHIFQAVQ